MRAVILLPEPSSYIPIKEPLLWRILERFHGIDHTLSGWIYNAKLARSLCKISTLDTDKILDFFNQQFMKKERK
jgi:hypothetical protein